MRVYLAGGVSGNLNPAWRSMVRIGSISPEGFIEGLKNENFWRGGKVIKGIYGETYIVTFRQ